MNGSEPLRVMSYNILTTRAWGPRWWWTLRRDAVIRAIRAFDADLLGLQEVRRPQLHFLRRELERYESVSVGRGGGERLGEHVPVLFDSRRFEKQGQGHFWLGPTPDIPGSRWWWSFPPRVASWVRLADRRAGGRELLMLNAHLCCFWAMARRRAATLMRERLTQLAAGAAVVVTGDFNAPTGGTVYDELLGPGGPHLREVLEDAGVGCSSRRIDWILCSEHFDVAAAGVDRRRHLGRAGSDHWPVTAELRWRPPGRSA